MRETFAAGRTGLGTTKAPHSEAFSHGGGGSRTPHADYDFPARREALASGAECDDSGPERSHVRAQGITNSCSRVSRLRRSARRARDGLPGATGWAICCARSGSVRSPWPCSNVGVDDVQLPAVFSHSRHQAARRQRPRRSRHGHRTGWARQDSNLDLTDYESAKSRKVWLTRAKYAAPLELRVDQVRIDCWGTRVERGGPGTYDSDRPRAGAASRAPSHGAR